MTTLAVAEQLYDALIVWKEQESLDVTAVSQPFFAMFSPGIIAGTYPSSTATYKILIDAVQNYADSFIVVVAKYTPPGGGLAEQYDRKTGSPVSAVDLSWSYAAFLTAFDARQGITPAFWGAKGLLSPETCSRGGGGGGGGLVAVTFNVHATTTYGGKFTWWLSIRSR